MKRLPYLQRIIMTLIACTILIATPLAAKENGNAPKSKPGYSVDGRTSASVLAAKRSHEVEKKDEVGLAVFSGLIVIAVIGFFSTEYFKKK